MINSKAEQLQVPEIRQFANQIENVPDAVNFTIGQPDFHTPDSIKIAGVQAILNNETGYSHNAGLLELRQAVASFFQDKYHFSYDPQTEIIITNGASEGIDSIFRTILNEGDEVILPAPIYSAYEPLIHLCGAKVVYLNTADTEFLPSPDRLESLITSKTKAVLFNYPSNPTGTILHKALLDELVAVMERHQLFVISDEIYSENTYSGEHCSFASYPSLKDQLFLIHGLSKSHSMTGWRIGFAMGPAHTMEHVLKVHLYNSICASLPSQMAAIEALTNCRDAPVEMNKSYKKRLAYAQQRLTDMGLDVVEPSGALYIFPSVKKFNIPSFDFATKLLHEKSVAVVPGSGFTEYGEGFIRISYACSMDVLKEGMDRLEAFVEDLK
ncbi:aminotransferase class I/II-fold pyridoxal phosphate-dependent enzyme [Virgibacillus sp. W0181]|uniref:aminotransferase class I/II-fold pyridoxal phosphate-dependent enzyme n=1 Tax=Virgibacillus sp. W0181 TaxID=3391581 RepID=UPI003F47EB42